MNFYKVWLGEVFYTNLAYCCIEDSLDNVVRKLVGSDRNYYGYTSAAPQYGKDFHSFWYRSNGRERLFYILEIKDYKGELVEM